MEAERQGKKSIRDQWEVGWTTRGAQCLGLGQPWCPWLPSSWLGSRMGWASRSCPAVPGSHQSSWHNCHTMSTPKRTQEGLGGWQEETVSTFSPEERVTKKTGKAHTWISLKQFVPIYISHLCLSAGIGIDSAVHHPHNFIAATGRRSSCMAREDLFWEQMLQTSLLEGIPIGFTQAGRMNRYFAYPLTTFFSDPGSNIFMKSFQLKSWVPWIQQLDFRPPPGLLCPLGWLCLFLPTQRWSHCKYHWVHPFPAIRTIPLSKDWLQG